MLRVGEVKPGEISRCVLLYSGGLDTSCMLKWLQERYECEVITVTLNIGQKTKDFKEIEEKAKKLGVRKHYTIDAREEFVREYAFRALKANALYEGEYPVSSSIARPLIARWGVEIARKEGADAIAHGCTGKGNDQIRFNVTIAALAPDLKILMPVLEWGMSREEEVEYALKHGVPVPVGKESPYSIDENLWGRSIECGPLEHPEVEPPEEVFAWTVPPEKAPDKPEYVEIRFEGGVPVAVNGEEMPPASLVEYLNELAGRHGIGRIDHIEDRFVGIKSREVYECPGAIILIKAHKDLEKLVLTRHEVFFKEKVDQEWTNLVYGGLWVDPLREDLEAFIDKANERVSGVVRVRLYKGHCMVVGRKSEYSLYDYSLATYERRQTFKQDAAPGFVELWGLQSRLAYIVKKKKVKGEKGLIAISSVREAGK